MPRLPCFWRNPGNSTFVTFKGSPTQIVQARTKTRVRPRSLVLKGNQQKDNKVGRGLLQKYALCMQRTSTGKRPFSGSMTLQLPLTTYHRGTIHGVKCGDCWLRNAGFRSASLQPIKFPTKPHPYDWIWMGNHLKNGWWIRGPVLINSETPKDKDWSKQEEATKRHFPTGPNIPKPWFEKNVTALCSPPLNMIRTKEVSHSKHVTSSEATLFQQEWPGFHGLPAMAQFVSCST